MVGDTLRLLKHTDDGSAALRKSVPPEPVEGGERTQKLAESGRVDNVPWLTLFFWKRIPVRRFQPAGKTISQGRHGQKLPHAGDPQRFR